MQNLLSSCKKIYYTTICDDISNDVITAKITFENEFLFINISEDIFKNNGKDSLTILLEFNLDLVKFNTLEIQLPGLSHIARPTLKIHNHEDEEEPQEEATTPQPDYPVPQAAP